MNPQTVRAWGQIIVSAYVLTALTVVAVFAFLTREAALEQVIVGAVVGYAAACVHFYIGDAAGSQTKDEVIARSDPPRVGEGEARNPITR